MLNFVVAVEPIAPNPINKQTCQNTDGKWLTLVYKNSILSKSYLVSDIYCQCNKGFVRISELTGWTGCGETNGFITEELFINELREKSLYARSVSGDMNNAYIKIAQDQINANKSRNISLWVGGLVLILLIIYFITKLTKKK